MKKLGYLLMVIMMLIATSPAQSDVYYQDADTLVLEYDVIIEGSDFYANDPWLTLTFTNISSGVVQLDIWASGLLETVTDTQYVREVYLNLDPALTTSSLVITRLDESDISPIATISPVSTDAYQATGDGLYDILFSFPPATGAMPNYDGLFTYDETLSYLFTYDTDDPTFDINSFLFLSTEAGGRETFLAAAFILDYYNQGGTNPIGYIAVGVPEPGTLLLLGSGLIGVVVLRRRFKK